MQGCPDPPPPRDETIKPHFFPYPPIKLKNPEKKKKKYPRDLLRLKFPDIRTTDSAGEASRPRSPSLSPEISRVAPNAPAVRRVGLGRNVLKSLLLA